jgi:hypothetical protein
VENVAGSVRHSASGQGDRPRPVRGGVRLRRLGWRPGSLRRQVRGAAGREALERPRHGVLLHALDPRPQAHRQAPGLGRRPHLRRCLRHGGGRPAHHRPHEQGFVLRHPLGPRLARAHPDRHRRPRGHTLSPLPGTPPPPPPPPPTSCISSRGSWIVETGETPSLQTFTNTL